MRLAGNIGVPALELLEQAPTDMAVVELSSYQIADLEIGPEVALITNLFREHTDWHGSEEAYRADKLRILELPGVRVAVLNGPMSRVAACTDRDERRCSATGGAGTRASRGSPRGELRDAGPSCPCAASTTR